MNKSKLAAFFDRDDDDDAPFPQKSVDDQKLSQYTTGTVRKSRREKEKEAAEAKKREEEREAARAYAEFVNDFDADGVARQKKGGFVKAGERVEEYTPSSRSGKERRDARTDDFALPGESSLAPPPKSRGKRAMDSFLEELKKDQAERDKHHGRYGGSGKFAGSGHDGPSSSRDYGDSLTTNIFVGNLPTHVTEPQLGNFFARQGPVASVKIMWPRTDPAVPADLSRRGKGGGLSGFVSFMKRKDAEAAVREMDGFEWQGHVLRVGWSKAVPIGPKAAYVADDSRSRSRSPDRKRTRSRSRGYRRSASPAGDRYGSKRDRSYSYSPSGSRSRSRSRKRYRSRSRSFSREVDPAEERFIRMVARKVKDQGQDFEEVLRQREQGKVKFAFLWDRKTPEYKYYRSLIHSSRKPDEVFDDDGYNSVYSTDSAEESEKERGRKGHLGKLARRRFEAMLRALSGRRGDLARCMTFSLEHADAAAEIVDIIISSLLNDATPVPRKVSRLYLICDILHNSAATIPNAWKFRQEFQSRLGLVFDHLSVIYHSFPGRITAETFKAQIIAVVEVWEDWIVFPAETTAEWRERLDGSKKREETEKEDKQELQAEERPSDSFASKFKASAFKPATTEAVPLQEAGKDDIDGELIPGEDLDGEPLVDDVDGEPLVADVDGEPLVDDNVDGEPINEPEGGEDFDGEPMALDSDDEDMDGKQVDDVDGEPINDVDGEPMDDDTDGEPMDDVDGEPI
ncbi:hypothetical protein M422DRAFT_225502 [Sphaerobolus stellatus SS14]|nr:hypothetical protein M422DRAFT_225502 [Sphaerobolus stellatus SS14]